MFDLIYFFLWQDTRIMIQENTNRMYPSVILMNGKRPYGSIGSTLYESFNVTKGENELSLTTFLKLLSRVLDLESFIVVVVTHREDLQV